MIRVIPSPKAKFANLPTLAIDVSAAHSVSRKGTGFGFQQTPSTPIELEDLTQTEALSKTIEKIRELKKSSLDTANLILEAPLSGAVSSGDAFLDAQLRPTDIPSNYPKLHLRRGQSRPWNGNAGAATMLMALMFLRSLAERMPESFTLNLFEGFWTWGAKPRKHHLVAKGLIEALRAGGNRIIKLSEDSFKYTTALQLLGIAAENQNHPPLIVFGNSGLGDAYQPS